MTWIEDNFLPRLRDNSTRSELATSEEQLISDKSIIEILKRFAPLLNMGIERAATFHGKGSNDSLSYYAHIGEDELELWDKMYGVRNRIMERVNDGRLFIPSELPSATALLDDTKEQRSGTSFSTAVELRNRNPKARRINLDEVIRVPIEPFNPDGMQVMIRPRIYMGGHGGHDQNGKATLYNAFMGVDLKLKDSHGRWAVAHIPGTGVHKWDEGPCYSPFGVASADVWFNTRIDHEIANSLSIRIDHPDYLMMHAELNDATTIDNIAVPNNQKLRLFFWQLQRFLSSGKQGIGYDFPQLTSHE